MLTYEKLEREYKNQIIECSKKEDRIRAKDGQLEEKDNKIKELENKIIELTDLVIEKGKKKHGRK